MSVPSRKAPPSSGRIPGFTLQDDIWFGDFNDEGARRTAAESLSAMAGRIMGARPIPAAAQKLVQLTRAEDADIHKVVRVLEMDPGLSQKVLRLVNSAGYGLRVRCTSLQHATALLGQSKMRQVATSAVLFDHFGKASALTRRKQEHGSLVASLCRYLAIHLGLPQDDLFTVGLLHDIGELMMLDDDLPGYAQLLEDHESSFDQLHFSERNLLGFDHAVLAAHVLASWRIPAPVPEVIALHHQPSRAHQHSLEVAAMVQTLRFADQMAHLLETKAHKTGPRELAESEAASYLDFSEVQISAMWKDLERVHEVTRNRRLNIIDVAPRTLSVPESLRPRQGSFNPGSIPETIGPNASDIEPERTLRPSELGTLNDERQNPHTISVDSYALPPSLLSSAKSAAMDTPASPRSANELSQHTAIATTSTETSETKDDRLSAGLLEQSTAYDERLPITADLNPATRRAQENTPALSPSGARNGNAQSVFRLELPHEPSIDESEEARLMAMFGTAPSVRAPATSEMPSHTAALPSRARADESESLQKSPEAMPGDQKWFQRESVHDFSPEVFPCAFCYAPTFGATCPVCSAQVCATHQPAGREWCVACEDEYQEYSRTHAISPVAPLAAAVSVSVAVGASWVFFSLDVALGILSIGLASVFGAFVAHRAKTKRGFLLARRRAVEATTEEGVEGSTGPRFSRSERPEAQLLDELATEAAQEPMERVEPDPLSMPVPPARAEGFLIEPICEPPRPSLMSFRRPGEHIPVYDSLLAPSLGSPMSVAPAALGVSILGPKTLTPPDEALIEQPKTLAPPAEQPKALGQSDETLVEAESLPSAVSLVNDEAHLANAFSNGSPRSVPPAATDSRATESQEPHNETDPASSVFPAARSSRPPPLEAEAGPFLERGNAHALRPATESFASPQEVPSAARNALSVESMTTETFDDEDNQTTSNHPSSPPPSEVEPLRHSLRTLPPTYGLPPLEDLAPPSEAEKPTVDSSAPLGDATLVGFLAPLCAPGRALSRISLPQLPYVASYCSGGSLRDLVSIDSGKGS